jgi:hypothetical protein
MSVSQRCTTHQRSNLTADRLLEDSLADLFTRFGVAVSVMEADAGFTGGAYVHTDGSLLFVRPAGRPEAEWELTARAMLGAALRVPLPPLPEPYRLTEMEPSE